MVVVVVSVVVAVVVGVGVVELLRTSEDDLRSARAVGGRRTS